MDFGIRGFLGEGGIVPIWYFKIVDGRQLRWVIHLCFASFNFGVGAELVIVKSRLKLGLPGMSKSFVSGDEITFNIKRGSRSEEESGAKKDSASRGTKNGSR